MTKTFEEKAREWLDSGVAWGVPLATAEDINQAVLSFSRHLDQEAQEKPVEELCGEVLVMKKAKCVKILGHSGDHYDDEKQVWWFQRVSQPEKPKQHEDCSPLPKCSKCCWEVDPKWTGPCAHCGSRKPQQPEKIEELKVILIGTDEFDKKGIWYLKEKLNEAIRTLNRLTHKD